jgi:C-terminal processing protease CtpA/Prc
MRTHFKLFVFCMVLEACSSASADSPRDPEPAPAPVGECKETETVCEGLDVKRCESIEGGRFHWNAKAACNEDQVCRNGGCVAIGGEEALRLTAIRMLVQESRKNGATATLVDYAALEQTLRQELFLGDGSPQAYTRTLWNGLLAIPQGHQLLSLKDEEDYDNYESAGLSLGSLSRYDACLRPYKDHAVVTFVGNRSKLFKTGDEIVAVAGKRGSELRTLLLAQPIGIGTLPPTDVGRMASEWRSFFSIDRKGTVLTVRRGGKESDLTLPVASAIRNGFGCDDAFARDFTQPAIGTVLGDGTGVLYIPAFAPTTLDVFEADVGPAFDKVKDTPRLIIDLRGNVGGRLDSALDLVSQLPDAKRADCFEFFERNPGSNPATYRSLGLRTVDPATVPQPARFPYRGKVAVLIDGTTHSAAEAFALAAKLATSAVVIGTKTAGAFGRINGDEALVLPGSPALQVRINRSQVRTPDGKMLEGNSVTPHIEVEYEPETLAKGHDPMLDRAIAELSK